MKHMNIHYEFIHEGVTTNMLSLTHCNTDVMTTNVLTKPLPHGKLPFMQLHWVCKIVSPCWINCFTSIFGFTFSKGVICFTVFFQRPAGSFFPPVWGFFDAPMLSTQDHSSSCTQVWFLHVLALTLAGVCWNYVGLPYVCADQA